MVLMVQEQDSRFSHLNLPLMFISNGNGLKAHDMSN